MSRKLIIAVGVGAIFSFLLDDGDVGDGIRLLWLDF